MHWLLESWYGILPSPWAQVALGLVSLVCGVVVGLERERREKPAGLRTIALISFGAAVFTMVSVRIGGAGGSDPARIAAQIVTGVGFLGAGVILHQGARIVTGITTAATIWAMAAVGMVAGAGYGAAAFASSVVLFLVLVVGEWAELRFLEPCKRTGGRLTFASDAGRGRPRIIGLLDDFSVADADRHWGHETPEVESLSFVYCAEHKQHRDVLRRLAESPIVRSMETDLPVPAAEPSGTAGSG